MSRKFISLSSDFGVGTQGIGIMKSVILQMCPDAEIIDLWHGIPGFEIMEGAWTMESVEQLPVGCHVCVVDPGVGTDRMAIIIKAKRGDYLIGPDNGLLIPATRRLGGIEKVVEITNEKYMRRPVCPVFHGRDVFAPAAAWLSKGVRLEEFGQPIDPQKLVKAPYDEANVSEGVVTGEVIHINHFGSASVNVIFKDFEKSGIKYKDDIEIETNVNRINTKLLRTFGEVTKGEVIAFPDDYGRIEVAINHGRFVDKFGVKLGDKITIRKPL
jgi:hypothetical protein